MSAVSEMPRWDLSPFFPRLESEEFAAATRKIELALGEMEDSLNWADNASTDPAAAFERLASHYNALREDMRLVQSYLGALVTTDSFDEAARAKDSEFDALSSRLQKLSTRFTAWIGKLNVEELLGASEVARKHAFFLQKSKQIAEHLMNPGQEALAADLNSSSGLAWGRLHGHLTSQLLVSVELPGGAQKLSMSSVRNLAYDPDRAVRQAAYLAEIAAWRTVEVPLAASMNGIKGQVNVLARRRKWTSPLENALFEANIDRETLDAMLGAARGSFSFFRRYLQAKARLIGSQRLAWFDLFAPVGVRAGSWPYDKAEAFVKEQFDRYSPKLGEFASRAFRERWIDAEPRLGKRDGAYCSSFRKSESRILMNYKPSFGSVMTLAHELGHGYHNLCLADRTAMQKETPMTLAETASIFCETVIKRVYLAEAPPEEQLGVLEGVIQGHCQLVVDITSRMEFEQEVFLKRKERDLSAGELCELMTKAQADTYGEGLDSEFLHPYMWAVKPHYYSAHRSFYNFPYMFGLLFGLGLYARYEKDPENFKAGYDDLLSSTGMHDVATLASRFGIDVRSQDFWTESLSVISQDVEHFVRLAG